MKNLIKKLKNYLTELLMDDDMLLISREEFEDEMNGLMGEVEELEDSIGSVYVNEDYIRDAVNDAIYNLDISDDAVEGLDSLEHATNQAKDRIKAMRRTYAPTKKEKKMEEVVDSAVNRIMDNNIDA